MKRVAVIASFLMLAGVVSAQHRFAWEFDGELRSGLGYATVDQALASAPQEFGTDGLLDAEDLDAAADSYSAQLSFEAGLNARLHLRWMFDGLALETVASLIVLHAPYGYRPPVAVAVAPGELAVRLEWLRERWDSWGFMASGGRVRLIDPTAEVADQLVDGLLLAAGSDAFYVEAVAGFTGLLDKYLYTPRLAADDGSQFSSPGYGAVNRLLAQLRVDAALPASQRLSLFGVLYQGLAPADQRAIWIGLAGAGPIASFGASPEWSQLLPGDPWPSPRLPGELSHQTAAVALARLDGSLPGLYLATRLHLHLADLPVSVEAGGAFASGDGALGTYLPLSPKPQGVVAALPLQNLVKLDAAVRVRLMDGRQPMVASVGTAVYLLPESPSGASGFAAVETVGGIELELLSDLRVLGSAGVTVSALGVTPFLSLEGRVSL